MKRTDSRELAEAEKLLSEIHSWSEEEIEALPLFYKRKAKKYRQTKFLKQPGQD